MFDRCQPHAGPRDILRDSRGVAAIEFAFVALFLGVAVLNVADIGIYLYKRMQVENAAQMGTMKALDTCNPDKVPATIAGKCPELNAAVTAAIQSTSLGSSVTLGALTEAYYCVSSSNALQLMPGGVSNKPANCSGAGMPALKPGDYLTVTVSFSYTPLFNGITVASLFTTPITKTAWVRLI
jgi:Flp pilus assembly protein TadG